MLVPPAYVVATIVRRSRSASAASSCRCRRSGSRSPRLLVSAVDWALAGAVLYVLLPPSPLSFLAVPEHLPRRHPARHGQPRSRRRRRVRGAHGGAPQALSPSGQLLPALVVYRAVYYLLPLAVALIALVADELWQRRTHVARAGAIIGQATERLTPRCSRSSPSCPEWSCCSPAPRPRRRDGSSCSTRSAARRHRDVAFLGSVAGAALLILSQGLARRLDAAYYLSSIVMVVGMVASLLKGFDYEEAALLLLVLSCSGGRGRRSIAAPPSSTRDSPPRGSRRWPARSVLRSGSGSLRSSTWTTRASSGGSSSCTARRHGSCARRSARPWPCCCLRSHGSSATHRTRRRCQPMPISMTWDGRSRHRPRRLRSSSIFATRPALQRQPDRVRHVRRAGTHVGGAGRSGRARSRTVRPDPRVSRAVRRLRRRAGLLRGRKRPPSPVRRLRPDVRQAR